MEKIAFGGSCYWCTEAIFQSLIGVEKVEQGWLASEGNDESFSEGVVIYFDPDTIPLKVLIQIHLHTHKSTSNHSMRHKYRSAVYTYSEKQQALSSQYIDELQAEFDKPIITRVIPFKDFRLSPDHMLNYYYSRPDKPFCTNIIAPKLRTLMDKFGSYTKDIGL